ncbi:hypothetical protein AB1N83_006112 [Pleurotus pulmonarius]
MAMCGSGEITPCKSYQRRILERAGLSSSRVVSKMIDEDRVNAASQPPLTLLRTNAQIFTDLGCAARGRLSMLVLHHRIISASPLMHQGCSYGRRQFAAFMWETDGVLHLSLTWFSSSHHFPLAIDASHLPRRI